MHAEFCWENLKEIKERKGRKPLGRPGYEWEDSTKLKLKELGCDSIDGIHVAQESDKWWVIVNVPINLQIP